MNSISIFKRAALVGCDIVQTLDSVAKLRDSGDQNTGSSLRQSAVVNRLALLGFSVAQIIMNSQGTKSKYISILKNIEGCFRVYNLFIQAQLAARELADGKIGQARFIEKAFLAPLSDFLGVFSEAEGYEEASFLELSPEELKIATRPIYESDSEGDLSIVGYKLINLEEVYRKLKSRVQETSFFTTIRVAAESSALSYTASTVYHALQTLFFRPTQVPAQAQNAVLQPILQWEEDFRLGNFANIPLPLENDELFRLFKCMITKAPIRHPVQDPNGCTLYERSAILLWLKTKPTSPATRKPLFPEQLIEVPKIQAMIDDRLAWHHQQLMQYLEQNAQHPLDPQMAAAAALHK